MYKRRQRNLLDTHGQKADNKLQISFENLVP